MFAKQFVCFSLLASSLVAADTAAGPPINFQRQVRPILSNNCFLCHGPDKGTRMADLRLDIREGAFATRKNGVVVVPGKPDESLLIKRVLSSDDKFRMPPAFTHKTLAPEQKEILRKWVAQGATWKDHWAFVAPVRPEPPTIKNTVWAKTPVDRFILAKLEAIGLSPAEEAERRTLLRRVTLDLTGLPPTPEEVKSFVQDKSPQAYERVVDRLLASPHYGEHQAHYWLDAARYADTQGLHIDNYREMWPYRDWVIQAFNSNMRFDEFTVDQLAGDLLPNATLNQKIASGFQRCNVTTNEGGSVPAEVEAMYARDRADTTGTVWMGLTIGCATCHDHKFDPIAQKEMYAMTAFFRNTTQNALDGNVPDTPPVVVVPGPEDRQKWDELQDLRARLKSKLTDARTAANPAFEAWLRSPARGKLESPFAASEIARWKPDPAAKDLTVVPGPDATAGAVQFSKESSVQLPNVAQIEFDKPFTIATWLKLPKDHESYTLASQRDTKGEGDAKKSFGWNAGIESYNVEPAVPEITLQDTDGNYISARPSGDYGLKPGVWYHAIYTYDGSRSRRGLRIYINGSSVPSYGNGKDLSLLTSTIHASSPLLLGQQGKGVFEGGAMAGFKILNRHTDEQDAQLLYSQDVVEAAAGKNIPDLSESDRQALLTYYIQSVEPSTRAEVAQLHQVDASRYEIAQRSPVTFVQQERSDADPVAHVLYRGLYDQPREEVRPTVPAVLPPMPQSSPRNRLGLARWLVDPGNPLTARVTVNRFWQQLFGTGLVKTAEDFGSQGEPPVNQDLLDWLAVDFRESGWDVKRTMRLLVTSAAYRQSALTTPEKLERDRDNRLLSRGPRYRMDAEMLRDYALSVSGLLVPQIGGPSVKPYQPAKIWETVAMEESNTKIYQQDSGDALYRRSLYTFWKRSAPPPSMDIFDAPSREECVVRRERTNTPLQALVTMNDPQYVEAARTLAQKALLSSKGNINKQVNYITTRLMSRDLDEKERGIVEKSYRDYLAFYQSDPGSAENLIGVGASKANATLPEPKLAALTMVANELMNLDEVLVK